MSSMMDAGQYASKSLVTKRTDRIDLIQDYGAVSDAVGIADATISTGSAVLTSSVGLFTSSMIGKLIYVSNAGGSGAPLRTTVASFQSATQITLAATASAGSIISGGPNINAIIGTDNTAALNAAIAAAQAASSSAGVLSRFQTMPSIYIPAGNYLFGSGTTPLQVAGVGIYGAGRWATRLWFGHAGPLFSMGTFNATPATAYDGPASNFRLRDLSIASPIYMPSAWEASRVGVGVQDNGSGELFLDNVYFAGLKYGVFATTASDFSRFGPNCYFSTCDVGIYLGVGTQQIYIQGTDFYFCVEGMVIEGAPQGEVIGCSWENSLIADVKFEGLITGNTRGGVPYNTSGAAYSGNWTFRGCWFETGAGGNTTRNNNNNIWVNTASTVFGWNGIAVRDSYLVSGGRTQITNGTVAFFRDSGVIPANPRIENLTVRGNSINSVYRYDGTYSTSAPVLRDCTLPSDGTVATVRGLTGSQMVWSGGSLSGGLSIFPTFSGFTDLTLLQYGTGRQSGTSPLMSVRAGNTSTLISGIAQGGAFIDAYMTSTLASAGSVTMDASQANCWTVTLNANATSSTVSNFTIAGQMFTLTWIIGTANVTYTWPTNCKFAGGAAPTASTTSGYSDSVTFIYDGTNLREVSRSIAVR